MEEDEDFKPFWDQGSANRIRPRGSHSLLKLWLILPAVVLLSIAAAGFLVALGLRAASQIPRPNIIMRSWDSINVVLVVLAFVCGALSRNTGEQQEETRRWYEYGRDRAGFSRSSSSLRRLRSFSSYPNLRSESLWPMSNEEPWRFYDDTAIGNGYYSSIDEESKKKTPNAEPLVKDVMPETVEIKRTDARYMAGLQKVQKRKGNRISQERRTAMSDLNYQPPPPPPPPPRRSKQREKAVYGTKKKEKPKKEDKPFKDPIPTPPPPPPPQKEGIYYTKKKKIYKIEAVKEFVLEETDRSPLIPMPPPPPPPPFKVPALRFIQEGDFIRIGSFGSTVSGSSDVDSSDEMASGREMPPTTAPDIDTTANTFIHRVRAGL